MRSTSDSSVVTTSAEQNDTNAEQAACLQTKKCNQEKL